MLREGMWESNGVKRNWVICKYKEIIIIVGWN